MQLVVTGVGADGRSRIERITHPDPEPSAEAGLASVAVWDTNSWPPEIPFIRPAELKPYDARVPTGATSWRFVRYLPLAATQPHRTDTLDYDVVLSGCVTLELEADEVLLVTGDLVVVTGVIHRWRAGPEGCVLTALMIGIAS